MRKKGFTLIEIMVVVTIMGILAAVAIPLYSGYANRAKRVEAEEQLMTLASAEEDYFNTYRQYTIDKDMLKKYYGIEFGGTGNKHYSIDFPSDDTENSSRATYKAKAYVCFTKQGTSCDKGAANVTCWVSNSEHSSICKENN
ncbi:prepilin-type N-terminal cleavage/methylation domain-containing protein [bacterium]|nr:prepilin-type N-terminal cleavage/methylation domain-containing protein [bacterium]